MVKEYQGSPLHVVSPTHHKPKQPYAPVARYIDFLTKFRQGHLKDRRQSANLSQRSPKPSRPKNPKHFDIVP